MNNLYINAKELPLNDLEVYGLSFDDLLKWDKKELSHFLSGGRSQLLNLNLLLANNQKIKIKAKLSLFKDSEGVHINIHHYNPVLTNVFNLTDFEFTDIQKDYLVITKTEKDPKSYMLYQRDKDINDIICISSDKLSFPLKATTIRKARCFNPININGEKVVLDLNKAHYFEFINQVQKSTI